MGRVKKYIGATRELYFIALIPPPDIRLVVEDLKKEIAEKYDSNHSLKSPSHVTLHMPFRWREDRQQVWIDNLEEIASHCMPFEIHLRDFGCFNPRVIYISILPSDALTNLFQSIRRMARTKFNIFNSDYKTRGFNPHMTIAARDLRRQNFELAWQDFGNRTFSYDWAVRSLYLLKHDGKRWETLRQFEFQIVG